MNPARQQLSALEIDPGSRGQAVFIPVVRLSPVGLTWARLPKDARRFLFLVLGIFTGYLVFSRTFAYFGVPGLYPGEILLLAAAVGRYGWLRVYLAAVRLRPGLVVSVSLFLLWGCLEALRGYLAGFPILDIAKGLPANYYPLLLFAGLSAGRLITMPQLRNYFAWLTLATGISATIFTVAGNLGVFTRTLPWAPEVPILGGAAMPPFCLLAYAALSTRLTQRFLIFSFPVVIALLIGGRASLLGALAGFAVLALQPSRFRHILRLAAVATAGVGIWLAFSGLLPNLGGRSGRATPSLVAARLASLVDPELAETLVEGTDADLDALRVDAGDTQWRRDLWSATVDSLTSTSDWLTGHGYGPVLGDLLPGFQGEGYGHDLRTPHNFAIYLLGYTGIIGCLLYLAVLLSLLMEFIRCPASLAKGAAIATSASIVVMALSGNLLETPFGAVPAYVGIGIFLAVAQRKPLSLPVG